VRGVAVPLDGVAGASRSIIVRDCWWYLISSPVNSQKKKLAGPVLIRACAHCPINVSHAVNYMPTGVLTISTTEHMVHLIIRLSQCMIHSKV
jgi:hypothetical protein